MKKGLLIFTVLTFCFCIAKGQDKNILKANSFSIGAEFAYPVGLFGEVYSSAIGASVQGNFAVTKNAALTLNIGYLSYFLKNTYGGGSEGFIPVLGGVQFNISPAIFGAVQLGLTFSTISGGGSAFTYSPGVGYNISRKINALLKYTGKVKSAIASNAIGLRVAYTFGR
jgi:hypothetical protein